VRWVREEDLLLGELGGLLMFDLETGQHYLLMQRKMCVVLRQASVSDSACLLRSGPVIFDSPS
jgi:hypothetical protein